MKTGTKKVLGFVSYVLLGVLLVAFAISFQTNTPEARERVGFITYGGVEDTGWNAMTYRGMQEACENLGLELLVRDHVEENDGSCPQTVRELVSAGATIIVLNSNSYAEEMRDLLAEYPEVMFYCASADYDADNLTKYSIRMYQARYLSGIVAGLATKTDKIGFVAAMKQHEVCRSINAFALGVRRVNPDAEVLVSWTGSWINQEKETAAANNLIEAGADVLTYHQDRPYVIEAAEAAGIYSIGYYQAVENASERRLTCAECDWGPLFERVLQDHLRGQIGGQSEWLGLESGVVRLTEYSPLVSQKARDEVEKATQEILSGLDVFTNVIYDNNGNLRCGEGEAISDETLNHGIDWLAEGVRVYE